LGALRRTFETIAMAKVSTSAVEARHIGMLLPADRITMNRERLLNDAKQSARELAAAATPPRCRAPIFRRRARTCWPPSNSAST
jgi:3-hydroxyacyl-CoA dehydrogenase